jgi:hypothetical protein
VITINTIEVNKIYPIIGALQLAAKIWTDRVTAHYTAGISSSYYVITLCIAQTNSTVLDLLRRNAYREWNFTIGTFKFEFPGKENDFKNYEIKLEDISITFHIVAIDTSKKCGPRSNLNFVDFI